VNWPAPIRRPAQPRGASPLWLIEPIPDQIARFPSTRYYGSKRKLLAWMYGHLGPIRFHTVLDAFGGSGSVSLLFKAMHKSVTYHDAFRFNEDVARTLVGGRPALTRPDVEAALRAVHPRAGTISKHFEGLFFRNEENAWLDGFAARHCHQKNAPNATALLRYLVYQACLKKRPFNLFHRANLALRTTPGVKRSFGNAATWERSFEHHALQAYDELAKAPDSIGVAATVLPAGDAASIASGYDLVYIDPPYIVREERYNRDDYWRRYHFLEGLARYKEWAGLIDRASDIRLFEPPPWFTEWGRKTTFRDRLFAFIDTHRHSIVVLSYVSSAVPSETEIMTHFEARFARISVHSAAHYHALSKTRKRELLFVGLPK
jgi:adenine-specific DNA-methyltransferase